ncbi:MAG TPA: hypothetical protein VHC86_16400 [Opitutaceae bacterium]|nr:hypothetical protein [Opitutaceae bacterium]
MHSAQHTHACTLRSEIVGSPATWLPRREDLLEWLNAFVARSHRASYELGETEEADLAALDAYLRRMKVPAAGAA